jgi:hypothetical protein
MALTVSPQIRIVALIGLLLAVGFGGGMRLLGGGAGSATAVVPSQNSAIVRAKDVASRASARTKKPATATAATHKAVAARPKTKAVSAPAKAPVKPVRAAKQASPALAAGLPLSLGQALTASRTVVAVVYSPQAEVDGIAFAEARAGAALAGAGFVGLNVLSQAEVGKLTEQLGLLPDPAVLVFTRPATLAARIDGFADKETVAQAAHNAAHGT